MGEHAVLNGRQRLKTMVLPFTNSNGANDDFIDTITYEVTTDLARLSNVYVLPSLTSLYYYKQARDIATIRETLGISYILAGEVKGSPACVEVNLGLVDARSDAEIWGKSLTVKIENIFDLETQITEAIATKLGIRPTRSAGKVVALRTPDDLQGFDLWVRGMGTLIQGGWIRESTLEARKFFEDATRKNPQDYRSLAWLATVIASDYLNRWGVGKSELNLARDAKNKALTLDPYYAQTYLAAGLIRRAKGDHGQAFKDFETALGIDAGFASACAQKANELINLGRPQEALAPIDIAVQDSHGDPSIGIFYWIKGRALFFIGRFQDAIPWLEKSVAERDNITFNRIFLISSYALIGQIVDARKALYDFNRIFPGYTLDLIHQHDRNVPNNNPVIILGLAIRSIGLALAGMR